MLHTGPVAALALGGMIAGFTLAYVPQSRTVVPMSWLYQVGIAVFRQGQLHGTEHVEPSQQTRSTHSPPSNGRQAQLQHALAVSIRGSRAWYRMV